LSNLSIILLTFSSLFAAAGQIMLKVGANGKVEIIDFINWSIFIGLVFYVFGTVIWVYVLSYEKMVNVYAFTILTFAIVYSVGVFFIGERIT